MINSNDVNLIIFDLGGTIISDVKAVYEAVRRAFLKLGWEVPANEADFSHYMVMPSDEFYQAITPPENRARWQEAREKVRQEYYATFLEYSTPYPEVAKTLKTLKKRGFRLTLYSRASSRIVTDTISKLGMKNDFIYVKTPEDDILEKTRLAQKIIDTFKATAAIVGDSIQDIEAAKATNSLSIGVLYSYGGKEPEEADINISAFSDLLAIFDRRLPIFERVLGEIKKKKRRDRAFVIGVTGIDGAGKTKFADSLEKYLISRKYPTQVIHLDDFHNPRAIRYAGENQAENYFLRSFNINLIIEKLLAPLQIKPTLSARLTLLDVDTDKYKVVKNYAINHDTIVIFEGVFLFRKELSPYIDCKIFLNIPLEESKKRAIVRDPQAIVSKYDVKYLRAQLKYMNEYPPPLTANIIIDNIDWEYPKITFPRE